MTDTNPSKMQVGALFLALCSYYHGIGGPSLTTSTPTSPVVTADAIQCELYPILHITEQSLYWHITAPTRIAASPAPFAVVPTVKQTPYSEALLSL
jgi:hypothetical protein